MTFNDLKFPKDFSKKKKMALYKSWFVPNKADPNLQLSLNVDLDQYGLTPTAALTVALTDLIRQTKKADREKECKSLITAVKSMNTVIMCITLSSKCMDDEVIEHPKGDITVFSQEENPLNPTLYTIWATIRGKIIESETLDNYTATDFDVTYDPGTDTLVVNNVTLNPKIINKVLLGAT